MATNPPAAPAPASPKTKASPKQTIPTSLALQTSKGLLAGAERVVIYGTGGIGKSTLAAWLPSAYFLDVEKSTGRIEVDRDISITTWEQLRGKLAWIETNKPANIRSLIIDTATVAEEMAKEHVVCNRKTDKGRTVDSIEGFGWGKGWQYVAEEFNGLLADLDRLISIGINVCLICHDVSSPVPNPAGEDFIRWEPHLYSGDKKGRGSIRERVKQWADHVLFIGYDIFVEDGKGTGTGSRTIYTSERPTHIAKSRAIQTSIVFEAQAPGAIWEKLNLNN